MQLESEIVTNRDSEAAKAADIGEAIYSGEGNGISEVEPGFDLATHNGGSLEDVPGFNLLPPMVESIGSNEPYSTDSVWLSAPDAGQLHYDGMGGAEGVCGRDDREQINANSAPPWRMICQLLITFPGGARSRGTGWFIGPRTVVTAGHCVHSRRSGGWAQSIEVVPGMNGRLRPFGSSVSTNLASVRGWINDAQPEYDYGCIILPESDRLGDKVGWFGFSTLSDGDLKDLLVNNSGYPGDKAFGTQWYNAGRISQIENRHLGYMIDTAPGQSGSPMWRFDKSTGTRNSVGIHNYGGCANKSTRITKDVFANMKTWKAQGS